MGERGVLPASRNQTIREHLEAIRDRNTHPIPPHKWNDGDYRDAVAALAVLAGGGVFRGSARNEPT